VEVGVADPAEEHLDCHIVVRWNAVVHHVHTGNPSDRRRKQR
jgi:hypothetical protein